MSAAGSVGGSLEQANRPAWSAAAARVQSYLEVAGLKRSAAADLAQEIASGCATQQPDLPEDEAILAYQQRHGART